jgi:hypothetical protein
MRNALARLQTAFAYSAEITFFVAGSVFPVLRIRLSKDFLSNSSLAIRRSMRFPTARLIRNMPVSNAYRITWVARIRGP